MNINRFSAIPAYQSDVFLTTNQSVRDCSGPTQYFGDEAGLIYYGPIDDLKIYNGKGVGLRFTDSVWVEKRPYRIWVHISQEVIDGSSRKRSFVAEIAELKKAVDAKEEVVAFFVGAYPVKTTVEIKGGATFDLYSAELSSVNHLSLAFARS